MRVAIRVMRVTPVPVGRALAAVAGTLAWAFMGARRRTVLRNLSYTAPQRSPAQRRRLARRTFLNMASAAMDLFRLPGLSRADVVAMFDIRGREHLDRACAMGRGVILVTGHLGPYELGAACASALGYPVHTIVEDLPPDVLEALAVYRGATGMGLINMRDGLRAAYRLLGEGQVLALAADRVIGEAPSAVELPFAGGIRRCRGPAVFAMATGRPWSSATSRAIRRAAPAMSCTSTRRSARRRQDGRTSPPHQGDRRPVGGVRADLPRPVVRLPAAVGRW